ncbi:hypothetical protein JOQ06_000637, partial [Pogonophryne albipinna]
ALYEGSHWCAEAVAFVLLTVFVLRLREVRDPYDYPTHSRPVPRDPTHSRPVPRDPVPHQGRMQAPNNQRYYPSSPRADQQHRAAVRQDVLPPPPAGQRGEHFYEAAGGRVDGYRQANPGGYTSLERHPDTGELYRDDRQPEQKRKNPLIDAV